MLISFHYDGILKYKAPAFVLDIEPKREEADTKNETRDAFIEN